MASWSANIQAQINAVQTYQRETFSFTKYCEHYIVGYSVHGVQIIKGKCHYGGIRDIGADIGTHYPGNLLAFITSVYTADLSAEVIGLQAIGKLNLTAFAGGHYPKDLIAAVAVHQPENITAYIRGFDFRNLPASIGVFHHSDLPAQISIIPPSDLPAYLKVWPQEDLAGSLHGWQEAYLGAYINAPGTVQLPAIIGVHAPRDLKALIKGWAREVPSDLGAIITGFGVSDLSAYIRARELTNLSAYLFAIRPRNIGAFIHGWQEANLGATINALDYPWNLPAYINSVGMGIDLPASISIKQSTGFSNDLSAYILVTQGRGNLTASLAVKQAKGLSAYIDTCNDIGNLPASIYPKKLRLTGVVSLITMEHRNLSATINIPCFYSDLRDLSAYIRAVFQSNLGAIIYPKNYVWGNKNLNATFGYAPHTVVQDKLTINLTVNALGFRTEDKYLVNLKLYLAAANLGATIIPTHRPYDLSAYINALGIVPYDFDSWKGSERVYDKTYTQVIRDYEDVDIYFESIVKDYFYSSGSDVVAKVDRYTHFVTKVASYYSPATSRRLDRRLHKVKRLYDLRKFDSIDEAMRYAIWYVTTYPKQNLMASINAVASRGSYELSARIGATRYYSTGNNLTSYINGTKTHPYDVVISYTNDGVGFLNF